MKNRLDETTSPYLLQHRDNPVHWRPWDRQALEEAQRTGKPILLSVGYAACHWCHVMAHESFEDEATAEVMNRRFVNIKVDREERPDLDAVYQTALAALGQHGGWPLTMFLTPEGRPFWGGTYFPPSPRHGLPSFRDVLEAIGDVYEREPDKVRRNVEALHQAITGHLHGPTDPARPGALSLDLLNTCARALLQAFDMTHGGLAGAPKFPQTHVLDFLWRAHLRSKDAELGRAVTFSLERMCQGGIYDHLGGGFARYATDEAWLVPHFEKMLYDNASLVELMTAVWRKTRDPLLERRITETIGWLEREMIAEHGAFAASLDADSEGEEGRFYVWSEAEIDAVLGEDSPPFKAAYGVVPHGNWEDGKNILNRSGPQPDDVDEAFLERCRKALLARRETRVRPGRDDKVLADWNGLMIAALLKAAETFERKAWMDLARRAYDGIRLNMTRKDGRLAHSCRQGRLQPEAMLEDYAAMARAAVTLFETEGDENALAQAETWMEIVESHYRDKDGGGYFQSADDATDIIIRPKSMNDGPTPSGNGLAAEVLVRLWLLTGKEVWRERAQAVIDAFTGDVRRNFPNLSTLLGGAELMIAPMQAVLVAEPGDKTARPLARVLAETPVPALTVTRIAPGRSLPQGHPAAGKSEAVAAPAVFLCRDFTCLPPITDAELLRKAIIEP